MKNRNWISFFKLVKAYCLDLSLAFFPRKIIHTGVSMSNKDLIYEKITALFADDSMPPMILLDGKWGCGKSYYVTQTLKPNLDKVNGDGKRQKVLYFSVYGISDLDDFRDKLISAYYLKDENTSGLLTPLADLTVALGKHFDAEKGGLAATFLSGFKGVAKHSLLSKLSDFILILDDLERVSGADLCQQILAECLEFSASAERNVKVIAVGNSERIPELDLFLNKVFIDRVVFSKTVDQLFEVAFHNLSLDMPAEKDVKQLITKLDVKNLRILKRTANKLAPLIKEVTDTPGMYVSNSISLLACQIVTLCHVHYELTTTYEEIRDCLTDDWAIALSGIDDGTNSTEPESQKELRDKLSLVRNVSDELIQYACGELLDIKLGECGLPMTSKPLDNLFYNFLGRLSDKEFEEGYDELLQYILKKEKVECKRWFFCLDFLDNLITKRYVSAPVFIELSPENFAKIEHKNIQFLDSEPDYLYRGRFTNSALMALLDEVQCSIRKKQDDNNFDSLIAQMRQSWSDVDLPIYKKWDLKPLFNLLPAKLLDQCLVDWEPKDVSLFTDFLGARYKLANITTYYCDELAFWKKLADTIEELITDKGPSLKIGSLIDLSMVVKDITTRLDSGRIDK
jgi:hypothetical protein